MFNFSRRINKVEIANMFPVRFFDGAEDGAAPGGGSGMETDVLEKETSEPENVFDNDSGIPKELQEQALQNDPELRQLQDDKKARKAAVKAEKGKGKGEKPTEEPILVEKGADLVDKGKEKDNSTDEKPVTDEDFAALDFQDNVIPGITGEDMKKLGPAAVAALADFYEKHSEVSTKATETQSVLDKYFQDPVIKARKEMIDSGKTQYQIRGISDTEKQSAVSMLVKQLDFTQEEAAQAFEILKSGFQTILSQSVEDNVQNRLLEEDSKRKVSETTTKARGVFLSFGKFNKDMQFKETDPNKFWKKEKNAEGKEVDVLDEKHPEIEKFKKFVIPFMQSLGKAGYSYENVVKMAEEFGEDGMYALAAKKLNLPVAINTSGVFGEMLKTELSKRMKPFLRAAASEELPAEGGKGAVPGPKVKGKENIVDGIDVFKLNDDEKYYDSVIKQKASDSTWPEKVAELAEKGQRIRRKQTTKT